MASPVPKPPHKRQRRNLRSTAAVVAATGAVRPDLPTSYHPMTQSWWTTIWSSPISDEWVDADVPGLVALAQLVDDFWTVPKELRTRAHAEVRMAAREYGLSPFSRRQLQWEVKRVEAARPAVAPVPRRRNGKAVLSALTGGKA